MDGYWLQFLGGFFVTLKVALSALALGLGLGMLGAFGKLSHIPWLEKIINLITGLIRGLPELLVIFFIYYGCTIILSNLFGTYIAISSFVAGVIALGLIFGAYATETIRGAFLAIPHGQFEAAKAFGFRHAQTYRRILIPQVWYHALPGLGNLWFVLLKDTALVALIGLPDIMRVASNASASTMQPFMVYSVAAMIYLLLTSLSLLGQRYIAKRTSCYIVETC